MSTAAKLDDMEDEDDYMQPNIMGVPMSRRLESVATQGREPLTDGHNTSSRSIRKQGRKRTMQGESKENLHQDHGCCHD